MQSEELDEARSSSDTAATANPDMTYTEKRETPSPRLKPHIVITEDSK